MSAASLARDRQVATISTKAISDRHPTSQAGKWQLTFQDDFSSSKLKNSKWSTCYPWSGCATGNSGQFAEAQCYQSTNVSQRDGSLALTAKRQKASCKGQRRPYTSGMVQAHKHADQTYGYYEARIKIPSGEGMWPAMWLLPSNLGWPPEIDVMEMFGSQAHPSHVTHTVHFKDGKTSDAVYAPGGHLDGGYHVFGLDWRKGRLDWYVDGHRVKHYAGPGVPSIPMYPVLDLAVRSKFQTPSVIPASMHIDYLRVWRRG